MKKPDDWLKIERVKLSAIASKLLIWNCNQPVSNQIHNAHYKAEIQPLYDRIDELWDIFWARKDAAPTRYIINQVTGCIRTQWQCSKSTDPNPLVYFLPLKENWEVMLTTI